VQAGILHHLTSQHMALNACIYVVNVVYFHLDAQELHTIQMPLDETSSDLLTNFYECVLIRLKCIYNFCYVHVTFISLWYSFGTIFIKLLHRHINPMSNVNSCFSCFRLFKKTSLSRMKKPGNYSLEFPAEMEPEGSGPTRGVAVGL